MNLDEAMAITDNYRIWLSGGRVEMNSSEIVAITLAAEVERLRDELAEAKAANVALVDVIDCYFNKLNDLENITNWLRERMKERGER